MSWQDMGTYWAWRGIGTKPPTPSKKRIDYANIHHLGMFLAIGVWDDDKYTELNRIEYKRLLENK
jgi:hypothetical protein